MSTIGPYAPSTNFQIELLNPSESISKAVVRDPDSIFSMIAENATVEKTILQTLLKDASIFLVKGQKLPKTIGEWKRRCVPFLITLETLYSSDLNFYQTLDPTVRLKVEINPHLKIDGMLWKEARVFRDGIVHFLQM